MTFDNFRSENNKCKIKKVENANIEFMKNFGLKVLVEQSLMRK